MEACGRAFAYFSPWFPHKVRPDVHGAGQELPFPLLPRQGKAPVGHPPKGLAVVAILGAPVIALINQPPRHQFSMGPGAARDNQLLSYGLRAPSSGDDRRHDVLLRATPTCEPCSRAGKLASEWPRISSLFPAMSPRLASP